MCTQGVEWADTGGLYFVKLSLVLNGFTCNGERQKIIK